MPVRTVHLCMFTSLHLSCVFKVSLHEDFSAFPSYDVVKNKQLVGFSPDGDQVAIGRRFYGERIG